MFPGIADVHIETDGHHDAAIFVTNGLPFRIDTVVLVGPARIDVLIPGNLWPLVQIVKHVKNLVFIRQILDRSVGQDFAHSYHEACPGRGAMEAVHDEEAAALQVAAHALGLIIVEVPIGTLTA